MLTPVTGATVWCVLAARGMESPAPAAGLAPRSPPPAPPAAPGHQPSFKLRFAAQREQGRSYVSPVKPLGLPSTVTHKFYVAESASAVDEAAAGRALGRIEDMFCRGPVDKYRAPATSQHVYGWYCRPPTPEQLALRADRRLNHHIRDSAWLKARLLVLAADDKLKEK